MRVTVCELPDERDAFEDEWRQLVEHVHTSRSQLVLLPDMPFCEWFTRARPDAAVWMAAVRAHDAWEQRLAELAPAAVLASRPVDFGNERYDEGFIWDIEHGLRSAHAKSRTRDENGKTPWYNSATPEFTPTEVNGAHVGLLIGSELWMEDVLGTYRQEGIDLLAIPRSAGASAFTEWLTHACTAALLTDAFVLSSNRSGTFGGQGWIIAPDGHVLGLTSPSEPFFSLDLSLRTELTSGRVRTPQPAPDWIDPLETGVPPYS
jgi:N-carbamoylputrescine amidase